MIIKFLYAIYPGTQYFTSQMTYEIQDRMGN